MNRRKLLIGMGAMAGGGSAIIGSGAFTAAQINRDVNINVVSDSDALVRLGPCTDAAGNPHPNGQYVVEENGQFGLQVSDSNDAIDGEGVNPESAYRFDNVFEICNQGSRSVCVDLHIPEIQPVSPTALPDSEEVGSAFEGEIPSVIFYEGDDINAVIDVETLDVNRPEAFHLEPGECVCIGFAVLSYGFAPNTNLIDGDLTIKAFANAACADESGTEPAPDPGPSVGDAILEIALEGVGSGPPEDAPFGVQRGPPVDIPGGPMFVHTWTVNNVEFESLEEISFNYEPFSSRFDLEDIEADDLEVTIAGERTEEFDVLSASTDELSLGFDPTKTVSDETIEIRIVRGPGSASMGEGEQPPEITLTGDGESRSPSEVTIVRRGPGIA